MQAYKKIQMKQHTLWTILVPASLFLAAACHAPQQKTAKQYACKMADDFPASCPYMSRTPSGTWVMSWIRQDSGQTMMWFARFQDSSMSFGPPTPVPPSRGVEPHGENMPKLVFSGDGRVLAMYGVKTPRPDNPYTGTVYYCWSTDEGAHWTKPVPLFKSAQSFDQRYFDIAVLPSGRVGAVWLNNSEPSGSTLYFATAGPDGIFGPGKAIARHTCQCCRTDLLADSSGTIHVAWRAILGDTVRDMEYCRSIDSGRTFSDPVRISPDNWVVSGCPHTGPSMAENAEGVHFAWFTMGGGGGVYYTRTPDKGGHFLPRDPVSQVTSARHPQIAGLPDGDLALVWDEGAGPATAPHQRIGLQMRGPDGLNLGTRYLTPDTVSAYFPQIAVLNNTQGIVAYTRGAGQNERVCYRVVRLTP